MRPKKIPNPGSIAATVAGCLCAVYDNHHGDLRAAHDRGGFWITQGCQLHDTEAWGEQWEQEVANVRTDRAMAAQPDFKIRRPIKRKK